MIETEDLACSRMERSHDLLMKITYYPLLYFTWFSAIVMFVLFAAGFYEFYKGLMILFTLKPLPEIYPTIDIAALKMSIRALEFLLLAPLPFLLIWSLSKYVGTMFHGDQTAESKSELFFVKSLEAALFISIISASIISKALSKEGLDYTVAISGAIVIGTLSYYFFNLEKISANLKSKSGKEVVSCNKKGKINS